ncbi:hypothetical protein [Roseibium alexandrii]|uniref:DUF5648 domain-containing protein n=1 Tax=Roseibium alexandrii TaxID=388408 RepID=A0A0M7ANY5_9HYPH|nr:hypothetical protein [Roseibium alexandrii]CTQ75940.1 hypothetical protein LAX5112_04417 [Roseibium alexandrii]
MSISYFSDSRGNFGYYNINTGAAEVLATGSVVFTDIAISSTGQFYGITFSNLYTFSFSDGYVVAKNVGALAGGGFNSLEFSEDGKLYGGSGRSVYEINISNAQTTLIFSDFSSSSSGDIFINGENLFLSTSANRLELLNLSTLSVSTVVENTPSSLFGLADTPAGLFGFAGDSIYSIDVDTGVTTFAREVEFSNTLWGATYYPDAAEKHATGVWRFFNTETGSHFYTNSTAERDAIATTLPNFVYEGNAFDVASSGSGDIDVFRFYNTETGTHFYTASELERDNIINSLSNFAYEGVAYKAYSDNGDGSHEALYRFYNTSNNSHFYTASDAERDYIISTLGNYSYEGVAYFIDIV